jgi:hypothetical protein
MFCDAFLGWESLSWLREEEVNGSESEVSDEDGLGRFTTHLTSKESQR